MHCQQSALLYQVHYFTGWKLFRQMHKGRLNAAFSELIKIDIILAFWLVFLFCGKLVKGPCPGLRLVSVVSLPKPQTSSSRLLTELNHKGCPYIDFTNLEKVALLSADLYCFLSATYLPLPYLLAHPCLSQRKSRMWSGGMICLSKSKPSISNAIKQSQTIRDNIPIISMEIRNGMQ